MKTIGRTLAIPFLTLLLLLACQAVNAAPIRNLFNTGVDSTGALLGPNEVDPHYTLLTSPDETAPGPDAFTLQPGFPVGPWAAEGPDSRWIAPRGTDGTSSSPGSYVYAMSFDLEDLDPETAEITGKISADDQLGSIKLNGNNIAFAVGGFDNLHNFTIPKGSPFQSGVNTLEFTVVNGGTAANPTGFRVQMTGTAVAPGESPIIVRSPSAAELVVGDTLILNVEATGSPELTYQWLFEGNPIENATEARLLKTSIGESDAGRYTVRVTNPHGDATSEAAVVVVLKPFPGLFNTGVDDQRAILPDDAVDPHYVLVVNEQAPGAADAFAQSSIPAPPWIANNVVSRWVGPTVNATAIGGAYHYRLTLDLSQHDPATAYVAGIWASDDLGSIYLNGADTGFRSAGFGGFVPFTLNTGFISGLNSLEFRVVNGGANPTGLRVENLRGTAEARIVQPKSPQIVVQPRGGNRFVTGDFSFAVVADGSLPLSYQWFHNNTPLDNATGSTLDLSNLTPAQAGAYKVRVSNNLGDITSDEAVLVVVEPREYGVFNTAVGLDGVALPVGQEDPHYLLVANADPIYNGVRPLATVGAIPPWLANDADSAWISARGDGSASTSPGVYRYRLLFFIDLAEEVATAALTANVATDDGSQGAFLNGERVSFSSAGFGAFRELTVPEGGPFVQGLNILDIVVENGGPDRNPSGLRVDDAVLAGVTVRPAIRTAFREGNLELSWTAAATGYTLESASNPAGPWADSGLTPAEGNPNLVVVPPDGGARYFRLSKP